MLLEYKQTIIIGVLFFMFRNRISLFQLLSFVPPLLAPTGLYLAGDKQVFSVKTIDGAYTAFRVPDDNKGGTFILNQNTDTPLHVYVNKDKKNFDTKMNPPASEDVQIEKNCIALSDKKLLGIVHYLFITEMPNRRISITDTEKILTYIDEAIQMRTGNESKFKINQTKWDNVKEALDEAIFAKQLKQEQAKSSFMPIRVVSSSSSQES